MHSFTRVRTIKFGQQINLLIGDIATDEVANVLSESGVHVGPRCRRKVQSEVVGRNSSLLGAEVVAVLETLFVARLRLGRVI